MLELFDAAVSGTRMHLTLPPQFQCRADGLVREIIKGEQVTQTQLTNFQAKIEANIKLDDGVETKREFEIATELFGQHHRFTIPAAEFSRMDWPIERMGADAITFPNQRDYARTAIQSVSIGAAERCIYTHTGWRKINADWIFLHANGAIGQTGDVAGIEVRLCGALSGFQIPTSVFEIATAVRASLRLAGLVPAAIGFPLLAATYRAVFGDADFAIHLTGETGAFKSEIAALCQQHFGLGLDRVHLPAAWSSTANALEMTSFHAKDVLVVIDDFAPHGNASEISQYHFAADRVFRAIGNRAGRARLDSTARLREPRPPRGLILSTGEDVPRGQSVRARILVLELARGVIDPRDLTAGQGDARAGIYATAMRGFIQRVAGKYEETRSSFTAKVTALRQTAMNDSAHARTPEIVANLQAAFEVFLSFAVDCGAIGASERDRFAADCWSALREAAASQAKHQASTEPTARFLETLRSCLASGKAHLASRDDGTPDHSPGACGWRSNGTGAWASQGDCVGWVVGDAVYLESPAAFRAVQTAGRDTAEQLAVTESTLKKRLHERGLLASIDEKRETLTVRRTLSGSVKNVLHLHRETLLPEAADDEAGGDL